MTFSAAQPEPYAQIIIANYKTQSFRLENNARRLEFSRFGSLELMYPQVHPGLRVGTTGNAVIRLDISQTLYDGGLSSAQAFNAEALAIARQIDILSQLDDDIVEDISQYLDYHQGLETVALLTQTSGQLNELLDLAEVRIDGGIGTNDEVALFALKVAEIDTDIQIAQSKADLARGYLAQYSSKDLDVPPSTLAFEENRPPLLLMAALADRELARSEYEIARSKARPQVSLEGSVAIDLAIGKSVPGVTLDIGRDDPISLFGNKELQLAAEEFSFKDLELQEATREVELEAQQLISEISALQEQLARTEDLAMQSQDRLDEFQDRFLSGTATIGEAVSLIDTVDRVLDSKISIKYRVLAAELKLASLTGNLVADISVGSAP